MGQSIGLLVVLLHLFTQQQEINTLEETLAVYTTIKTDRPFPSTEQLINNLLERKTVKAFVECNK